ncbi:MAG: DUF1579 family protein [Vicinamibacterales bacterium]
MDDLLNAAGTWHAIYKLRDPASAISGDSDSTAHVHRVLGRRFVRVDYTWADKGTPQEGSLLVGWEKSTGVVTMAWIDSWHNSDRVMVLTGSVRDDGTLDARGSYGAPPGPDWGWRTELFATADLLSMVMFNVSPEGRDELAVDAQYKRNGPAA